MLFVTILYDFGHNKIN